MLLNNFTTIITKTEPRPSIIHGHKAYQLIGFWLSSMRELVEFYMNKVNELKEKDVDKKWDVEIEIEED